MTIHALYEGGVFRPTDDVKLREGTHVEVIVPRDAVRRDPGSVARRLGEIAAMNPSDGAGDRTSEDHDEVLYGGRPGQ